jgi:hypothetical protein
MADSNHPWTPLRDTAYVGLGLAVLGAKEAGRVARQITRDWPIRTELTEARARLHARAEQVAAPYSRRIQERIDQLLTLLPATAQTTYREARDAGQDLVERLRGAGPPTRSGRSKTRAA